MAATKCTRRAPVPEEIAGENPFSGRYVGKLKGLHLDVNIDMDKLRAYSKVLNIISGTMQQDSDSGMWKGPSTIAYFRTINETVKVTSTSATEKMISGETMVVLSDGSAYDGKIGISLKFPEDKRAWLADVEVSIENKKSSFKRVTRTSLFFREVKIDIDYTDSLVWPVVELGQLMRHKSDRKLDPFAAFEDAGVKLHYNEAESQKIEDPTSHSPWTKADMYEAMMHYFDETDNSDQNIWCMLGTTPPDRRYMGFSFDRKGRRGFGLFLGHSSFGGYNSTNPKIRAEASRRLLHYFVHECGHALGLQHPFEIGQPDSLSWMNYAWKYDEKHRPGSFYESFDYGFTDAELRAIRHFPDKNFRAVCNKKALSIAVDYGKLTDFPDQKLADDDSDDNEESAEDAATTKKRMRKIELALKIKNPKISVGDTLRFEAKVTNVGKLPVLIEQGLSIEEGNLALSVTFPDGSVEVLKSPASPILSGYTRPLVLYNDEVKEGQDRYSEMVNVGSSSRGYAFDTPGEYFIRAIYKGGRYAATSDTYKVKVTASDDADDDAKSQAAMALSLGASSYKRFTKVKEYWKRLAAGALTQKHQRIAQFISLAESLVNSSPRQPEYSGKKKARSRLGPKVLKNLPAAKTPAQVLKETEDILKYMQDEGTKSDNLDYMALVKTRGKLHLLVEQVSEANEEFNRMITDLLLRGVEQEELKRLARSWRKIKDPKPVEVKYKPENLQRKFTKILKWYPTVQADGEPELSGVGLGRPFGNFLEEDIRKGLKVVELLFNKYYETKDLIAVLTYADKLQKGREVNFLALHWALETFVVHCMDAKKGGLRYPDPEDIDKSMASSAALVETSRTGTPTEAWMNYWRCDADYNYHHRHWHIVYVVGRFVNGVNRNSPVFTNAPRHLERQGELFGYMHAQMLARYEAERESWGLRPTQEWEYNSTATEFNAGLELHSDPQYRTYAPRPTAQWDEGTRRQFQGWEAAYRSALNSGVVFGSVEITPNWSGHVLEPSSRLYADIYGNIHNQGHGVFGSLGLPPNATSYMNDTATAVRDTIFYRWHKRIDNLWQMNNVYYSAEIARDAPPVTLHVVIDTNASVPSGFEGWNGDWTSPPPTETKTIQTKLGPPMKKFEWDNKISHEPFFYHLRVKRNPGTPSSNELRLTIRIFIVPKNRETERIRFIEMDKFVVALASGIDHAVFTRADLHSSVIKRVPADMQNDFESRFVRNNPGFCECGWPYHMLLPRGTGTGEEYALYAIATDNAIDSIGIRTTCGSMSFCGARGQAYPDSRFMGYPFSGPMRVGGTNTAIPTAFDQITNGYKTSFIIRNNVMEPPSISAVDVWWPLVQLGLNDGTNRVNSVVTDYTRSGWTGRFRVLVNAQNIRANTASRVMVRFQGRGVGGGEYRVKDARIALRQGSTLGVTSGASVLYKGATSFTVAEEGIICDPSSFRVRPAGGDCFLTFTLESPGVFFRAGQSAQTVMTYRVANAATVGVNDADWSSVTISNRSRNIYCVSAIMAQT